MLLNYINEIYPFLKNDSPFSFLPPFPFCFGFRTQTPNSAHPASAVCMQAAAWVA